MLNKIKSKENKKDLMRYLPMKKLLQIFKYSKENLSLLKLNLKSVKYYNIIKLMYKNNVKNLYDDNYIKYCVCQEFSKENIECIFKIRNLLARELKYKKVILDLKNDTIDENGDEILMNFSEYNYIINKNFYLTIYSDLKLSKEAEQFFYETIKKEETYLYIQINNKNDFIDKLIDNWKGYIYSITFLENIDKDIFIKYLKNDSINLISELIIKNNLEKENECKDLLFKYFLPKCINLKNLTINFLPKKSENYGNFLVNSIQLEKLTIISEYNTVDTLNDIILDNNNIIKLNIEFELNAKDNNELKEFIIDFSFVKKLKNLKEIELKFYHSKKIIPKELFNSLNNLTKLEYIKIESNINTSIEEINNINNKNLNGFEIISIMEFNSEKFINLHPNLSYLKIDSSDTNEYKNINFSNKLSHFYSITGNESLFFQLFKQIQLNQIPLIELHFKINFLLGKMSYDCFHELANAFKYLPQLKSLGVLARPELNEKKNVEWIQNLKFLKNLNYFELYYYRLTDKELKLLIKSIRNLEFLEEFYIYDNKFEQSKVLKLFIYYKIPPILKKSNLMSITYQKREISDEEEEEEEDEEEKKKKKKKMEKEEEENETYSDNDYGKDKRRDVEFDDMVEQLGYPDLEADKNKFNFNILFD